MDAVITGKVSRTGVVLSCLFGQMAVCVLITDWVLDTVNTIKEETSFICSASPTHRHTHKKETVIHTPNTNKNSLPMLQRGTGKQRQKHTIIHNRAQTQSSMYEHTEQNAQCKWIAMLGTNSGGHAEHIDLRLCHFSCKTPFTHFDLQLYKHRH